MRILLTNSFLASRTGSEMAVRDYALALKALGHEVMVFANVLSRAWQTQFATQGIAAVERVEDLDARPDIVHGQHIPAILPCIERFPDTPVVQWIHDRGDPVDVPLRHPSVAHYIAVDEARRARVRYAGVAEAQVSVVANAVDLERFAFRKEAGGERRALCIVKREGLEQTIDIVARATARAGWSVDFVGAGVQHEVWDMERVLPRYALAVTSGRCAMEAIASGLAVIVCDYNRIAGLATRETWDALRRDNFGLDAMPDALSDERFAAALDAIDLEAAWAFASAARRDLDLNAAAQAVETLYRRVVRTHAPFVARDVRGAWLGDLQRLTQSHGAAHLAHWRRIADRSDASGQSSVD